MPSLTYLLDKIDGLIGSVNISVPIVPPRLIECGVVSRPGVSKIRTIQNVVKNMAAFGLPITDNTDGTQNDAVKFASAIVSAMIDEFLTNGVVQIPVELGSTSITALGIFT